MNNGNIYIKNHYYISTPGICTILHNFKMSWYLQLSTSFNGNWIFPLLLVLSGSAEVGVWSLRADWQEINYLTCKVLIFLSLGCYLLVASDLATQYLRKKVDFIRRNRAALWVAGSQRVAPVTENQPSISVISQPQAGPNCLGRKDHVR